MFLRVIFMFCFITRLWIHVQSAEILDNDKSKDCTCVPYYLCDQGNETIVVDGTGLIDLRLNDTKTCESYLEICCKDIITTNTPSTTPTTSLVHKECGITNKESIGFQIGSANDGQSLYGEFPWMIALLVKSAVQNGNKTDEVNIYQCGATLIHPQMVLTSANCMVKSFDKKLIARAGEWDTLTKAELFSHQDRNVRAIIMHPQFHRNALFYDVALLVLVEPFRIEEGVNIVCLPPPELVSESGDCLASGWGKDKYGKDGKYQTILKKIQLPIVPNDVCQKSLRNTRLGTYFKLHKTFVCAGGEKGKDTCKGDGGSPLICPITSNTNKFYQAGIVSWGIGCGDAIPGVYGNVAQFRGWIDEQMKYHKLNIDYDY